MENLIGKIDALLSYALFSDLIEDADINYTRNKLLALYKENSPDGNEKFICNKNFSDLSEAENEFEKIIESLLDSAYEKKLIPDNSVTQRDLFDAQIMDCLLPRPSDFQKLFFEKEKINPKKATDFFYHFSRASNYIKTYRVKKDLKWQTKTEYGTLDITINLSKPEKDPKAIAMAKQMKQSSYPKCLLCPENEGYAGHINHPARQNIRLIPVTLDNEEWFFQYSPYVYYNEHCIVLNKNHTPMVINESTFKKLFDFIDRFPHYLLGSNADLPIVGGSILTHEHFQGGAYSFPLNNAKILKSFLMSDFPELKCGIVKWPMSVIRICGKDKNKIIKASSKILEKWKNYSDEKAFIFAKTENEAHNTITPIAHKSGEEYTIDLVLRNNITTEEHPLGVFHPHEKLHHIKKENIGLIEVMGLAILPSRLKKELEEVQNAILEKKDLSQNPETKKHEQWVKGFLPKYKTIDSSNIEKILQDEVGLVFLEVLKDAGVFKQTEEGLEAFGRFIKEIEK